MAMNENIPNFKKHGFTIIELIIVIAILGILAAVITVSLSGVVRRASGTAMQSDLTIASSMLKKYYNDHGSYPASFNTNNCPVDNSSVIDSRYCIKISNNNAYTYAPVKPSDPTGYTLIETNTNGLIYKITDNTTTAVLYTPPKVFTGVLTPLATPTILTKGSNPSDIAISADGASVYVTGSVITVYNRNIDTGALTFSTTPSVAGASTGIVVSSDGASVYIVDGNYTISTYNRDTNTGILTAMSALTMSNTSGTRNIAMSADGESVYAANNGGTSHFFVSAFYRNTSNGVIGKLGAPLVTSSDPYNIAVSKDGTSIYTTSYMSDQILMFNRNTSTGVLSVSSTPGIGSAGGEPEGIAISNDGASVYVVNHASNTITAFSRNPSTSMLTYQNTTSTCITGGTAGLGIAISPDGGSVYVPCSSTMSMYSRNTTTGFLTPLATPSVATGQSPQHAAVSPDGKSVYVVNQNSSSVSMFNRD